MTSSKRVWHEASPSDLLAQGPLFRLNQGSHRLLHPILRRPDRQQGCCRLAPHRECSSRALNLPMVSQDHQPTETLKLPVLSVAWCMLWPESGLSKSSTGCSCGWDSRVRSPVKRHLSIRTHLTMTQLTLIVCGILF